MSIHAAIQACCLDKSLFRLEPLVMGEAERRAIYVSPTLYELLSGDRIEWVRARAFLDAFMVARQIGVPRYWNAHAQIARLREAEDEVWEFRVRAPKPGMRIFGRFAARDVCVALAWRPRDWLLDDKTEEGRRRWEEAKQECRYEWRSRFPSYEPVTAQNYPGDYIRDAYLLET